MEEYSGQSVDELIDMEKDYRIDSLILGFERALDIKKEQNGYGAMSNEELVILAVEGLEREVNNGGYRQFFENSSNEYVDIIVESLEKINCPFTADLTKKAIKLLGVTGDLSIESIEKAFDIDEDKLEIMEESFGILDGKYFAENTDGSIVDKLFEYIKANRDKIKFQ